jgi:hypothetical protein
MDQRDKDLELRERALNDKTGNNNTMSQKKLNGNSISKEQLIQHLEDLYLNNPDEFDKSLDKIKDSDLDLYSYCLDSLGMEEGEDEEEEQQ